MFQDPFQSDTSKFKKLLEKDSAKSEQRPAMVEEVQAESVFDRGTIQGLPPSIFQEVKNQQARLNADTETKAKVAKAFNNLFTDLNTKYGLQVSMDFDSFTNNLNVMIEPKNRQAAEYYLSEAYGAYKVTLYYQFLAAISLLSAQILDPKYLLSDSMTYDQKMDTIERLFGFMNTMNEISEKINVPNTDMRLRELTKSTDSGFDLSNPRIKGFADELWTEVKQLNK